MSGQEGFVFFILFSLVGAIGVISGLIPALVLTLLALFMIGSAYFWFALSSALDEMLPLPILFLWLVLLLLLALASGYLSTLIHEWEKENRRLHEQLSTLVAVDPETGFDNKERMFIELEMEFNRSKRYGHPFSFLLIRIRYFDQFEKLYGYGEKLRLLEHLANMIYQNVRSSDQKFRPEKDMFGLLLVNTAEKDVHHVVEKLKKALSVFQLKNKKFITLEFDIGSASFHENMDNYMEIFELAKEQVSFYVS
jgi:diguanylate cyclase (GGDEF)-like protein